MPETIGQFAKVRSPADYKAVRLDVVNAQTHYLGYSEVGAASSDPKWQIRRLTLEADGGIVSQWADGNAEYDNVWDDRASLNYS